MLLKPNTAVHSLTAAYLAWLLVLEPVCRAADIVLPPGLLRIQVICMHGRMPPQDDTDWAAAVHQLATCSANSTVSAHTWVLPHYIASEIARRPCLQ